MKKMLFFVAFACMTCFVGSQSLSVTDKDWHWEKGTIVLNTPQRPAGQTDVRQLTSTPPSKYPRP